MFGATFQIMVFCISVYERTIVHGVNTTVVITPNHDLLLCSTGTFSVVVGWL